MNTVLIPIDFTKSSNNAVSYAVAFSRNYPLKNIILVVSDYFTTFEEVIPSVDFVQFSWDKIQSTDWELITRFEKLKNTILKDLDPSITINFILGKDPLLVSLGNLVQKEHPDLIILGSEHTDTGEDSFMADHLIEIARASTVPLLIIPLRSVYENIETVVIPFNKSNVANIKLLKYLDKPKILSLPKLLFLNVGLAEKENDDTQISDHDLAEILHPLREFDHEIFFAEHKDILQSIKHFILKNRPQLIVALPGKHSTLYKILHRNIMKALAQNNLKPVLILKDL